MADNLLCPVFHQLNLLRGAREAIEAHMGVRPLFVEPGVKTGVPVLTDNPAEVGADRIVNCVAATERSHSTLCYHRKCWRWSRV